MKRFKSRSGKDVRIAQLSGHIAIVGGEYADLHERFHSDAYSQGCVSEDMQKNTVLDSVSPQQVEDLLSKSALDAAILAEFKRIVDENDQDAMTKSGPDARLLSTVVGQRISTQKRNAMWHKFQQAEEA
jgi:hypothetical protein